jgi:hypothetical protein
MLRRILTLAAAVLVLKVTAAVVWGYRDYLPPDFSNDFLRGRESYFFGGYRWAFYTHIASGPLFLLLGLTLVGESFRRRFPAWHRRLGRAQGVCVLLFVAPSGLWMAYFAQSGPVAAVSFAALAVTTAACTALGWRAAVRRKFAAHRLWMLRSFVLLCSAVVLRLIGGLATVAGIEAAWFDPIAAWLCWLMPLTAFEAWRIGGFRRDGNQFRDRQRPAERPSRAGIERDRALTIP